MADDREEKLLAFLAGQLALRDHRQCVKIELEYSPSQGFRPDPIKTWTPDSHPEIFGIFAPEDAQAGEDEAKVSERRHLFVQKLVGEMIAAAEDFADGYGSGTHRFVVRTHEHLHGRSTHRFKVLPGYHGEDQALEVAQQADPSQSGIVKMLMGHVEAKDRGMREMLSQFMGAMKHSIETLRQENEALRTQLTQKDEQRANMLALVEEAKSKEHDREIELAIVMGERERKDFAIKKVVNLLPVAMSAAMRKFAPGGGDGKVNGAKVKPSPLAECLGKLAMTISEQQKSQLQSVLSMEQVLSLQEVIAVALDGGSVLLPQLVEDLVSSLAHKPGQIQAIMGMFTHDQATLFVQAMQLAKAASKAAEPVSRAAAEATEHEPDDDTEEAMS